jgi:hypothetical protein
MFLLERSAIRLTNRAASGGLAAFDAAQDAGLSSVNCYCAGVEAWRRAHPDQRPEYAGKQAVAVILAAKVSLHVDRVGPGQSAAMRSRSSTRRARRSNPAAMRSS